MTAPGQPPTVVVGTAGHIDHGKTALLRALTGIDADRLPEERARGMTIDVGYAHLALPDGSELDFVDVPGHDGLVGNMLVGAGEIDAALLVVAADDGPRAQTLEHLELLDALGVTEALAVVTKADMLEPGSPDREARVLEVGALLDRTRFAGAPVLLVSSITGEGLDALRTALGELQARVLARRAATAGIRDPRLAIDRAFTVRGRGAVVTGTLRGGPVAAAARLRILPLGDEVRVRGVQVHGRDVHAATGGRVALNLVGVAPADLHRGQVVAADEAVEGTERLLVVLHRPADLAAARGRGRSDPAWPPAGVQRLHLGTAESGALVSRGARSLLPLPDGRVVASLRLDRRIAAAAGDAFVLRRPSPPATVAGGRVLDPRPLAGSSRRRATPERLMALASATGPEAAARALLALHGALPATRWRALGGDPAAPSAGPLVLVRDVLDDLASMARVTVAAHHDAEPDSSGVQVAALRTALALELRRRVSATPPDASGAAAALVDGLIAAGHLARDGDRVRDPTRTSGPPPALAAAMDRLVALLDSTTPPAFHDAVQASGCPTEGVRALETSGRVVRLEADLAFAATAYDRIADLAVRMARAAPLSPAALRDATGSSRKYVMAMLEDLVRRGVLQRTPEGHVPGPRALRPELGRPAPERPGPERSS